jgi:hypothetical protein
MPVLIDEAAKEVALRRWNLPECLHVPIAAVDEDAIRNYIGTVALRAALDALLVRKSKSNVEDVAYTIFPKRLWDMAQGDRAQLFGFYRMAFPAYKAINRKANGRGLYFERMMMYGRGPCDGNQLEYVLSQYNSRSGVRRSMLQTTTTRRIVYQAPYLF